MKSLLLVTSAILLSACTGPGVREAIGTGAEATPIVIHIAQSTIGVENHAGRPILNVRVAIDALGMATPFVRTIPSIDAGQTLTLPLTDFRTEEGVAFDPIAVAPTQVTVKARDTLTNTYDVTVPWE